MEKTIFENGKMIIRRTADVQSDLDAIPVMRDARPGENFRHVGSIPEIVAEQWAKDCGHAIGTAGFAEYVKRQLTSGDFSKLIVHGY